MKDSGVPSKGFCTGSCSQNSSALRAPPIRARCCFFGRVSVVSPSSLCFHVSVFKGGPPISAPWKKENGPKPIRWRSPYEFRHTHGSVLQGCGLKHLGYSLVAKRYRPVTFLEKRKQPCCVSIGDSCPN